MLDIARRIVSARAAAAVFSLAANLLALHLLSSEQYSLGSVAIASAAVALPILYQPFSKFVLVTGRWTEIGGLFWRLQPITSLLVVAAAACFMIYGSISLSIAMSAAAFAISQGWKEFCGEVARSMGDLRRMRDLYVYDAITTAILSGVMLIVVPRAEVFLVCSASSSAFWSIFLTPFSRFDVVGKIGLSRIAPVYRYSAGISITTFLNSSALALGRAAIKRASPPELSGAIQFLLDVLQKVIALIASSTLSAVVPEARNRPVSSLVPTVVAILLASLGGLIVLSIGVIASPIPLSSDTSSIPVVVALSCVIYTWSVRYKGSVLDMPLVSSQRYAFLVVPGAAAALGIVVFLATLPMNVIEFMWAMAMAMLAGGAVSAVVSRLVGLVDGRALIWMLFLPVSVAGLLAASGSIASVPALQP